ncbi:MAG: endolytic transglycosylase MltG [Caulobacteraceae bacterium]
MLIFTLWALWVFGSAGPAKEERTVVLRQGASLPEIASSLEEGGVIRSASVFMAAAQLSGAARGLKAGEYAFPKRASIAEVLDRIRSGKVVRHFVTIPEGITSEQVVDILMSNVVLEGSVAVPPEGSILPETYEVQRGEDRAEVLERMAKAQEKLLTALWPKRRKDLPFQTQVEALTLASIVEKETGLASERPRIAAVFVNRLAKGGKLESDPTIIYGLTKGRPLGRGIRLSELNTPTPYNTYFIQGLPPTPIANPGRAAIAAVLDPPRTTEQFFVANGTGGHVFASSFEDHQRNVARWRSIEQNQAKP